MSNQDKILESVERFSPDRSDWIDRPVERLPEQVRVTFTSGRVGTLDMRYPRAAHWAKMIDSQKARNLPVYVEIDPETDAVTNLLLPQVFKVETVALDENGDLLVALHPSSGGHVVLASDPNFEAMRESLESAAADGTLQLITETRDEHEIIDVGPAPEGAGDPFDPASDAEPDPPVTDARATEVFSLMAAQGCDPCTPSGDCITFLYPDDGCWIRAHMMCHLMRDGGPDTTTNPPEDPEKVWIRGSAGLSLRVETANHPDCQVRWFWHVAPTLDVILPGGNQKKVIDPSVSPAPELMADWKGRQNDPAATLTETAWTSYNSETDTRDVSFQQASMTGTYTMQRYRDLLQDRCNQFGPPPYSCVRRCFFIIDRNTFSDDEVEAMLASSSPAEVDDAFYVVLDGFSPQQLGFTAATMQVTPTLTTTPASVSGMSLAPDRLIFEDPAHLNRRQRLTWVYNISFTNISAFTAERISVPMTATVQTETANGALFLIQQPNPYEVDGATHWLSTDLRVFQLEEGQSKFAVTMGSNPNAFITQVLNNLNSGSTGGQTFENDISTDQQTSRLELSQTLDGTPVYNFAVAKVRYRALIRSATDVRVFFRMFPVMTTSIEYDQATTYRRHTSGTTVVPLLGIKNNATVGIPCFAAARINSATASLTTQTDPANVLTMPPDSTGTEVVRYFGCWLDINQTTPQFPLAPSPANGPFPSARLSVMDLVRSEHQCLVSEIAFTPAPAQANSTPAVSDKLAQRNLAIVQSPNPGADASRRVPQTFEIRPSPARLEHDEIMIDWGNIPEGSMATLYLPGMDVDEIIHLASQLYRTHRLIRIDRDTLRMPTGGISYLPIPFLDESVPGVLTVDLPEGIKAGDAYNVVVKQVTGDRVVLGIATTAHLRGFGPEWRHTVGAFQLTIPVRHSSEILPAQQRLLSNLRWIERAVPPGDRWSAPFGKYVQQVGARVDALGGDAGKIAPSPTGQWQAARRTCLALSAIAVLLITLIIVGLGLAVHSAVWAALAIGLALLGAVANQWVKTCRPRACEALLIGLVGVVLGVVVLVICLIAGVSAPQTVGITALGALVALGLGVTGWRWKCFGRL